MSGDPFNEDDLGWESMPSPSPGQSDDLGWEDASDDVWGEMPDNSKDADDVWGEMPESEPFPDATGSQSTGNSFLGDKAPVLSKKLVAVVLAGIVLVIALVFLFIDSIKIKPKAEPQQSNTQQSTNQPPQQAPSNSGDLSLIAIPDSTSMDYTGEVYQVNGVVSAKEKFLQGQQVVYCITVDVAFGTTTEHMKSWCNYGTYTAVNVGESVGLKYQQVADGFISVNEIFK